MQKLTRSRWFSIKKLWLKKQIAKIWLLLRFVSPSLYYLHGLNHFSLEMHFSERLLFLDAVEYNYLQDLCFDW